LRSRTSTVIYSLSIRCELKFKFNYDTCMVDLKKELTEHGEDLRAYAQRKPKSGWGVLHRILKDVYTKKPEAGIFVWIICSRDLAKVAVEDLKYIKRSREWRKYWNAEHPYDRDGDFLKELDSFLEKLQLQSPRTFKILTKRIETSGYFASTYHFRICEFAKPNETQR
jgi:hypothetical protein